MSYVQQVSSQMRSKKYLIDKISMGIRQNIKNNSIDPSLSMSLVGERSLKRELPILSEITFSRYVPTKHFIVTVRNYFFNNKLLSLWTTLVA